MAGTVDARLARFVPDRVVLLWGALLVLVEALAVLTYLRFAPVTATDPMIFVYPFVWLNVGLWAILTVSPPDADVRQRRGAVLLAAAYFLVLAYAGGMIGPPHSHGPGVSHQHTLSVTYRVATVPPGWGPMVAVETGRGYLQLLPYQVLGYAALAYLLYVTLLDAATAAIGAGLGLLSCVSCSWPVLASLLSGVASTATMTAVVYEVPYGLSTAAFVLTVAVLAYRPK